MAISLSLRLICLAALVYCHSQGVPLPSDDGNEVVVKRAPLNRLRSYNPLFIFQQSIRKPHVAKLSPKTSRHSIPRRWVRKTNNIDTNIQMLAWNHQLLPNMYSRQRMYNRWNNQFNAERLGKRSDVQWQFQNSLPILTSPFQQSTTETDDQYPSEPEALDLLLPESD